MQLKGYYCLELTKKHKNFRQWDFCCGSSAYFILVSSDSVRR